MVWRKMILIGALALSLGSITNGVQSISPTHAEVPQVIAERRYFIPHPVDSL